MMIGLTFWRFQISPAIGCPWKIPSDVTSKPSLGWNVLLRWIPLSNIRVYILQSPWTVVRLNHIFLKGCDLDLHPPKSGGHRGKFEGILAWDFPIENVLCHPGGDWNPGLVFGRSKICVDVFKIQVSCCVCFWKCVFFLPCSLRWIFTWVTSCNYI